MSKRKKKLVRTRFSGRAVVYIFRMVILPCIQLLFSYLSLNSVVCGMDALDEPRASTKKALNCSEIRILVRQIMESEGVHFNISNTLFLEHKYVKIQASQV